MECPHCGEPVPRRAKACPHCGSDDETGWRSSEDVDYEAVDLPDPGYGRPDEDDDDLDPEKAARRASARRAFRLIVVLLLGLALAGVLGYALGR